MGYRELLKRYIRFLEVRLGDNYIESIPRSRQSSFSSRDIGELRTIAAEIFRESHAAAIAAGQENYNQRLRILLNRHGLSVADAARLTGHDARIIRRWRSQPRSRRYLAMTAEEFAEFESRINAHGTIRRRT